MSDLSHERSRLYRLVDEFIKGYSDEDEDQTRIDQAMLVVVLNFEDLDDLESTKNPNPRELVVFAAESKRRYVQIGLLARLLHRLQERS